MILAVALTAQLRFDDYPVTEIYRGPAAPVQLATPEARKYRTRIREAAKEPANFAGRYRFAIWGCGSNCAAGVVIDLQTGQVFPAPMSESSGIVISAAMMQDSAIDFRPNSRLVVIRHGMGTVETSYFLWDGKRFTRLRQ